MSEPLQIPEYCNHGMQWIEIGNYLTPKRKFYKGKKYVCMKCGEIRAIDKNGVITILKTPYKQDGLEQL